MSRSYLFIPGDVPRMLQNLEVFEADCVIIDLEDSVAYDQKDEARLLTRTFLTDYHYEKPDIYIRINAHDDDTHMHDDIEAIKDLPIKGIVLPKTSIKALKSLQSLYEQYAIRLPVIGLIETPEVFFDLIPIAKHALIEGLLLGGEDLTKALDIERTDTGEEIRFARSQLIYAAKSFGKQVIDTPYTHVRALEGLKKDALFAAQLGFTGKAAIHPNHVDIINTVFSPSEARIQEAKRIVKQAETSGSSRFSLDGRMIDKPVIERAKNLLKRAEQYQNKRR